MFIWFSSWLNEHFNENTEKNRRYKPEFAVSRLKLLSLIFKNNLQIVDTIVFIQTPPK